MIEYTRGGVIDDHTRFLMRFNGNFKVEGNPTPSGDLFIANNGNLITDGSIQCVQYNKTDPFLYTIINTKESLLPELFYDGHPFTIDFWYKSTNLVTSCLVEHEYPNGIFYFGVVSTGTGFYFLFQTQQTGWHVDRVEANKWYHIAIVRSSNEYDILRCFVNGILIINTKTNNTLSLRSYNLGINTRGDGMDNGNFMMDDFRISDIARWESDFEPPKRKGL